MNYQKIYNKIISFRKDNCPTGYIEYHHIMPKSFGGSDKNENLVALTAREHYICHWLLTKIHKNHKVFYKKAILAFFRMHTANKSNQVRFCNSFAYEKLKKSFAKIISKSQTGCGNSQYNKKWIYSIKTKQNKKIDKNAEIPEGWALGRIINWDKKLFPIKKINKQALKIERHKQEARILFNKFIESDYTSITQFALHTNCGKGSAGLILSWQKYIPEYKLFCKHGSHFKNNFPTAGNKV